MFTIKFINEKNEIFTMKYPEVNNFCKNLCLLPENIEDFELFRQNYTVFNPFFDFVVFKLRYIFKTSFYTLASFRPWYSNTESLYDAAVKTDNYEIIMDSLKKMNDMHLEGFPVRKIERCSDANLNIQIIRDVPDSSFLIDASNYGYICTVNDEQGDHVVTSNTILNQLLGCNPLYEEVITNFINQGNAVSDGFALDFLIKQMGFIRITKNALVYNGVAISDKQKDLVSRAINASLIVEDMDSDLAYDKKETRLKF